MSGHDHYFYAPPPPPPALKPALGPPAAAVASARDKRSAEAQRQPPNNPSHAQNRGQIRKKQLDAPNDEAGPAPDHAAMASRRLSAFNPGGLDPGRAEPASVPPVMPIDAEVTRAQSSLSSTPNTAEGNTVGSSADKQKNNNPNNNPNNNNKNKTPNKQPPVKKNLDPVPIPGTGIMLVTDEDIKAWIQQRKKNWPSRKRVEEKTQEKELRDKERELIKTNQDELKRQRQDQGEEDNNSSQDNKRSKTLGDKNSKPLCKFFTRNGHCRWGQKCKYRHDASTTDTDSKDKNKNINSKSGSSKVRRFKPRKFEPPTKSSLYQLMVDNSMDQENGKVLDFVKFLFDKNHLQPVNLEDFEY